MLRSNYCPQGLLNYFRRLKHFHEAPCIKFVYNAVSYIFFLLLFSYYLLFAFQPPTDQIPSINWTEILVIIIISTMLIEDIRQVDFDEKSIENKSCFFFSFFVKKIDPFLANCPIILFKICFQVDFVLDLIYCFILVLFFVLPMQPIMINYPQRKLFLLMI